MERLNDMQKYATSLLKCAGLVRNRRQLRNNKESYCRLTCVHGVGFGSSCRSSKIHSAVDLALTFAKSRQSVQLEREDLSRFSHMGRWGSVPTAMKPKLKRKGWHSISKLCSP